MRKKYSHFIKSLIERACKLLFKELQTKEALKSFSNSLQKLQVDIYLGQSIVYNFHHLPDCFGNVTKSIDCCSSNGFLVSLEEFQKFEADSHPFSCTNMFSSSISNSTNQIDTVFLYFLVSI